MWNELNGSYQIVSGTGSGAISLPADFKGNTGGLILIGLWISCITAASQTVVIVAGGQIGTVTITVANRTLEKHFNHTLLMPIISITPTSFTANDAWLFEFVRRMNT